MKKWGKPTPLYPSVSPAAQLAARKVTHNLAVNCLWPWALVTVSQHQGFAGREGQCWEGLTLLGHCCSPLSSSAPLCQADVTICGDDL